MEKKRLSLLLGDLRFIDEGPKGLQIMAVNKLDLQLCWLNLKGERELLRWLKGKPMQENEDLPLGGYYKRFRTLDDTTKNDGDKK